MIGIQGENELEEVTKSPCDTSLDANSTNAVENRVVTQAINELNSDLTERSTTTPTFTRDSSTLYNLEENRTYFGRRGPVNNLLLTLATPDVVNAGTTAFPYKMSGVELPSNYIRTPLMRESTTDNENVVYGWAQISSEGLIAIYNDVAIPQNVEVFAQFTW